MTRRKYDPQIKVVCDTKERKRIHEEVYNIVHYYKKKHGTSVNDTLFKILKDGLDQNLSILNKVKEKDKSIKNMYEFLKMFSDSLIKEIDNQLSKYNKVKLSKSYYLNDYLEEKYPQFNKRNAVYLNMLKTHFFCEVSLFQDFMQLQPREANYFYYLANKKNEKINPEKFYSSFIKVWYDDIIFKDLYNNGEFNFKKIEDFVIKLYGFKKRISPDKLYESSQNPFKKGYFANLNKDYIEPRKKDPEQYYFKDFISDLNMLFKTYFPKIISYNNFNETLSSYDNNIFEDPHLRISLSNIFTDLFDFKGYSTYLNETYDSNSSVELIQFFGIWARQREFLNRIDNRRFHYNPDHFFINSHTYRFDLSFLRYSLFSLLEPNSQKKEIKLNDLSSYYLDSLLRILKDIKNQAINPDQLYQIESPMTIFEDPKDKEEFKKNTSSLKDLYRYPLIILIELTQKFVQKENKTKKEKFFSKNLCNLLILKENELREKKPEELYTIVWDNHNIIRNMKNVKKKKNDLNQQELLINKTLNLLSIISEENPEEAKEVAASYPLFQRMVKEIKRNKKNNKKLPEN